MDLIEQIYSDKLAIKSDFDTGNIDNNGKEIIETTVFLLKRKLTQSDLNDMSIIVIRSHDDYFGEYNKQSQLLSLFSLIESVTVDDKVQHVEIFSFLEKISSVRILYSSIMKQLHELKKK